MSAKKHLDRWLKCTERHDFGEERVLQFRKLSAVCKAYCDTILPIFLSALRNDSLTNDKQMSGNLSEVIK